MYNKKSTVSLAYGGRTSDYKAYLPTYSFHTMSLLKKNRLCTTCYCNGFYIKKKKKSKTILALS